MAEDIRLRTNNLCPPSRPDTFTAKTASLFITSGGACQTACDLIGKQRTKSSVEDDTTAEFIHDTQGLRNLRPQRCFVTVKLTKYESDPILANVGLNQIEELRRPSQRLAYSGFKGTRGQHLLQIFDSPFSLSCFTNPGVFASRAHH